MRLRELRESKNLSRYELARLSGVPAPTIAAIELHGADPRLSTLLKLKTTLDVSLDELCGLPVYKAPAERKLGVEEAKALITRILAKKGWANANDLTEAAKIHNVSERTLYRARDALGVWSVVLGSSNSKCTSVWALPGVPRDLVEQAAAKLHGKS